MSRYTTLTFSRTIGAGITDTFAQALSGSACNIVKIKCTPSIMGAPTEFFIYKDNTYAAADLVYATKQYTGNLIDPDEDNGTTILERNEGFVCAYEDKQNSNQIYFKIINSHSAPVVYAVTITYDPALTSTGLIPGVPDGLITKGIAQGLHIILGVLATLNNSTIDSAELRMLFIPAGSLIASPYDMRTAAEGGSFVDNGTTQRIFTGLYANVNGAQYLFDSAADGYWFFAWRMHNAVGWSNWTDGNVTPRYVRDYVKTNPTLDVDTGPPSVWQVTLEPGPSSNTVVCRATRPSVNGKIINFFTVQILDADTGTWVSLFTGSDAGHMKHDGRLIPLSLGPNRNTLIDPGNNGFGTAVNGDLVLLDVRGGTWNEQYCQWATVYSATVNTLTINGYYGPQVTSDLRIVIVKPPWAWSTNGYLGGEPNRGMYPSQNQDPNFFIGDTDTREFVSPPISIPNTVTNPEARVWFENFYSRADNNLTHSTGLLGFPSARLWTNLADRAWWVPVYGDPAYGTASFDVDGKVIITAANPQPGTHSRGNIWGLKSRFLVYPDLTGVIKIRVQFKNVTIPDGLGITSFESLFIGMINRVGIWSDLFHSVARWGNYQTNATIRFENCGLQDNDGDLGYSQGSSVLNPARPAAGYTLEIMAGFAEKITDSYVFQNATCQYKLNGGSWTPPASIDLNRRPYLPLSGIEILAGFMIPKNPSGSNLAGWTATIDELEVVQGFIVQSRIQAVK
jgi:hypothetical protein